MRVSISQKDHYWVLTCTGNAVGLPPGPLFDVSCALVDGARDIILDFSNLNFLGVGAVKTLKDTLEEIRGYGGHLGIVAPNMRVRRQLKINGLGKDIPVYPTMIDAVSKLDLIDYQPDSWLDQADLLLIWQKNTPLAVELRKVFKENPGNQQFRLKPVRNYEDAVDGLKKLPVQCVILDSTLEFFNVVKLFEFMQSNERTSNIPVLVATSDDRLEETQMMIHHGATEIIRTPLQGVEVIMRIHNAINFFGNGLVRE